MSAEIVEKKSVHPQYAELLCDFMFKRLFGSEANKDVLMGFLNMILEDVQIKDVKFISTEHLGLTKKDRKAIFDISCESTDGRTLIIEVQKGYQEHFRKRAVMSRWLAYLPSAVPHIPTCWMIFNLPIAYVS